MSGATLTCRYRAVRHLSETLYGGVFLCEDLLAPQAAGTRVVLKQVEILHAMRLLNGPPSEHGGAQAVDDPRQEKMLSNLLRRTGGHANIVHYLDDFIEDRVLYFVMEYCADGDLFDFLARHERSSLAPMDALAVVAQVAAGLAFLHSNQIAHRDLSLENILLQNGVCKIADFGLSTRCDQLACDRVGKAYYMAPEVVAGEQYDPKAADMWSLGIILFILLTGSPLVPIASSDEKTFAVFKRVGGVRAVLEAWGVLATLSYELVDLLDGLLQVSPVQRLTVQQVQEHRALVRWTACIPQKMLEVANAPVAYPGMHHA
jgi:serine/threonine protein kinase